MPNQKLIQRTLHLVKKMEALALVSEEQTCLTRTYGSDAIKRANHLVMKWMEEAGLETKIDNIGNVRGRLESNNYSNKTFLLGSHMDSVKNAGKYDGPLGLLIALDVVAQLKQTDNLPFNIEVVGFCDEEGVRFTTTYLGSSALSNTFENEWLDRRDDLGISLGELINKNGGEPSKIPSDALHPEECLGFYEVHIEQGPVLEKKNIPVGIVTSIAGQTRLEIIFKGKAGHAGTTPMSMRQDALCAAAVFISAIEHYAKDLSIPLVATVGKLITGPNVSNVIPEEVIFSLDVRSPENEIMEKALHELEGTAIKICEERNLTLNWKILQKNKPVYCDSGMCNLLQKAITKAGIDKIIKLPSGAGHDAVALSKIMPVSMLFVQCKDGISHHPDEFVKFEDIKAALSVSDNFVKELIHFHQSQNKVEVKQGIFKI